MNNIIKINQSQHTLASAYELSNFIKSQSILGFDIETRSLDWTEKILVSYAIGNFDTQYIVDHRNTHPDVSRSILLDLASTTIVGHNLLFDLSVIKTNMGISFNSILDTYQKETTLTKGKNSDKSYAGLIKEYFGVVISKSERLEFTTVGSKEFTETQINYMANDVKYLIPIYNKQKEVIESYNGICFSNLLFDIDDRIVPVVVDMQTTGIRYNINGHNKNVERIKQERNDLYYNLIELIKSHFTTYNLGSVDYAKTLEVNSVDDIEKLNLSSPTQLLKLFRQFDTSIKKTGEAVLSKYILNGANKDLKDIISLLLQYRQKEKLLSTYGEGFLKGLVVDEKNISRLVTNIQTNMTTTGRFTSGDMKEAYINNKGNMSNRKLGRFVNLQNLPRDARIRNLFLAEKGEEMVTIDLDGCELRILAAKSNDQRLVDGVGGQLDMHSAMATMSYRIITGDETFVVTSKINEELRTLHKRALFGLLYGAGPARVAEVLNVKMNVAKKVYNAIREYLSDAFEYLDTEVNNALKQGYCVLNNVTKRTIFLEDFTIYRNNGIIHPNIHRMRRQIYNALMQATNADMLKMCLIKIYEFFKEINAGSIKLSVYDEIAYSRPKGQQWIDEIVKDIIISTCNKFLSENVQMKLSYKVAPYWVK